MIRSRSIALLLLLPLVLAAATAEAAFKTLVILSRADGVYAQLSQALQSHVATQQRSDIELTVQSLENFHATNTFASTPALVVTVGVEAARRVAQANPSAPILHTLLPRDIATEILRTGRGKSATRHRDSAIFLDQPFSRQLDLLRLALPNHKRVAVILGPSTQNHAAELRAAARERSLTANIVTIHQREELLPRLEALLDNNDVLLSVAEPLAYHSETIHHVLLTTYRYQTPVMGLSKNYVDAGALLAVYSTPEQIGRQVAELLASLPVARATSLPAASYPKYFVVAVNRRVATSLDLYLDNDDILQQKLEASSRR